MTQTQVDTMRRMDVAVRAAASPEDSSLATLTGFYGTAVGRRGRRVWSVWKGADGGTGGGDQDKNSNQGGTPPPVTPAPTPGRR